MKTKVLPGSKWTYWTSERFHAYCHISSVFLISAEFLTRSWAWINHSYYILFILDDVKVRRWGTKHKWRPSQLTSTWCVLGNPIGLCTDIFWLSKWDSSRKHSWILRNSTPPPPTLFRIVMALQLVKTLHSVSIVGFVSIREICSKSPQWKHTDKWIVGI